MAEAEFAIQNTSENTLYRSAVGHKSELVNNTIETDGTKSIYLNEHQESEMLKKRQRRRHKKNSVTPEATKLKDSLDMPLVPKKQTFNHKPNSRNYIFSRPSTSEEKHTLAKEVVTETVTVPNSLKVVPSSQGGKVVVGLSTDLNKSLFLDETEELSPDALNNLNFSAQLVEETTKSENLFRESKSENNTGNTLLSSNVQRKNKNWWKSIHEEDPISLVLISSLPREPFMLNSPKGSETYVKSTENISKVFYFDGEALALYLVSTGNFQNPLNREQLSRTDCLNLDKYLKRYSLQTANVTDAFDILQTVRQNTSQTALNSTNTTAERERNRMLRLQREATVLLHSLFDFSSKKTEQQQRQKEQEQHRRKKKEKNEEINKPLVNETNESVPQLAESVLPNAAFSTLTVTDSEDIFLHKNKQDVSKLGNFKIGKSKPKYEENFPQMTSTMPNNKADGAPKNMPLWPIKPFNIKDYPDLVAKKHDLIKREENGWLKKRLLATQQFVAFSPFPIRFYLNCESADFAFVLEVEEELCNLLLSNKEFCLFQKLNKIRQEVVIQLCKYFFLECEVLDPKLSSTANCSVRVVKTQKSSLPVLKFSDLLNNFLLSRFYSERISSAGFKNIPKQEKKYFEQRYNVVIYSQGINISVIKNANLVKFFQPFSLNAEFSLVALFSNILVLQFEDKNIARNVFLKLDSLSVKELKLPKLLRLETLTPLRNTTKEKTIAKDVGEEETEEIDILKFKLVQWWPSSLDILLQQIDFMEK